MNTIPKGGDRMKGQTILVVEDHEAMRRAVRDALIGAFPAAGVIAATNGLEAVSLSGMFRPEVVIIDRQLPYMDGVQATKRIKVALPNTIVVFFSLSDNPTDQRVAKEAGADGYVRKEQGFDELLKVVTRLLCGRDSPRGAVVECSTPKVTAAGPRPRPRRA
jgi:DNA-binding NarL/FixJ family response regulator